MAVPVYVEQHQRNGDYAVPMELGAATKFTGKCYLFGKPGHKAANCKHHKTAALLGFASLLLSFVVLHALLL